MASTFPGAIDSFTDPLSGSPLNSPSHSAQHADLNDAVEKLEAAVGANGGVGAYSRMRIFTTEAQRDSVITSPVEGMVAYLTAATVPTAAGTVTNVPTGVLTIYNGSVWVCKTQVGANSAGTSSTFGTSYVNIGAAVTSVTLVTGTTALVSFAARINGTGNFAVLSVKTDTVAASDNWGAFNQTAAYVTVGRTFVMSGLTAGTNTFTCQAKSNVASGNLDQLSIVVEGIV